MDASPLAKLPPELRNRVYYEVLHQEDPIVLIFERCDERRERLHIHVDIPAITCPSEDCDAASRGHLKDLKCMRNRMAITATCKPLRKETRDLFFAINSFEIEVPVFGIYAPRTRQDEANEMLEDFLNLLSTSSAISAVKSITLDLGLVDFWWSESTPLCDMIAGLNNEFMKGLPGLPLELKAECGLCDADQTELCHVYIDMQNLAASIELALEHLTSWHQKEVEEMSYPEDREMCQEEFDTITSQLKACLVQTEMDEEV